MLARALSFEPNALIEIGDYVYWDQRTQMDSERAVVRERSRRFYQAYGMLDRFKANPQSVLFGTDIPFLDCRPQIGYVAASHITDEEKRLIYGQNAQRLFGL